MKSFHLSGRHGWGFRLAKKFLKPYPFSYFLSLMLGLLLVFFIIISYLKFSHGHILFGVTLSCVSFLIFSFSIAWVQQVEQLDEKEESEKKSKGKLSLKGRLS